MPRSLLAITGVVALVVISLGIKDFLDARKAAKHPPVTPTVTATSTPAPPQKDATPIKKKSVRTHRSGASAHEAAPGDANQATTMGNVQDSKTVQSTNTGATPIPVAENPESAMSAQTAHDEIVARLDRSDRVHMASQTMRFASSTVDCIPLPNGTETKDVDAGYYRNWAREYSCIKWP